ncbi:MAG: hypothetical protein LC640_13305, partial [Frankia sp.]|nr:hypothetical protein [Frankia sp.]
MARWRSITSQLTTVAALALAQLAVVAPVAQASVPPASYAASVSPSNVGSAVTRAYTFTITNTSPPESTLLLNVATITVPAQFSAPTLGATSAPLGQSWSASYAATTRRITLHGDSASALLPGQAVSLSAASTAPTACTTSAFTWATTASNDATGTAFGLSGGQPQVTVGPQTATSLVFGQQPSRAQVSSAIAPAVTVVAKDAGGATATCYNAPVSLSYATNPSSAAAPAGSTANAVNGVASFPGLTVGTVGFGYQ